MSADIKFKGLDSMPKVAKVASDLQLLLPDVDNFTSGFFNPRRLDTLRIRIFPFPKNEDCNEFFHTHRNKKYVCVNSNLLKRRYYTGLQYLLHGIAHSFCFLKDEIAEEAFCEFVSYKILEKFLQAKGERYKRRIIRSIMRASNKDYNVYFRAAKRISERDPDKLLKLNTKSKNRKISQRHVKKIFYKLVKRKHIDLEEDEKIPELERGFRKI